MSTHTTSQMSKSRRRLENPLSPTPSLPLRKKKNLSATKFAAICFLRFSGCRRRGCNKRGCLQTQTNANKCAQTQANADFRLSENGPETQINARKCEQTQTNANKRKSRNYTPFYAPPFAAGQDLRLHMRLRCPSRTPEIASDFPDKAKHGCVAIQGCNGKSLAFWGFELRFLSPKPLLSGGMLAIWLCQRGNR